MQVNKMAEPNLRDLLKRVQQRALLIGGMTATCVALLVTAVVAAIGALVFTSAVQVWHHVGSVVTSALLLPVLAINLPARLRPSQTGAVASMILAATTATAWIVFAGEDGYPLGIEPMFAALAVAACCLAADAIRPPPS